MKYTVGNTGKIIVMRLENGDPIYSSIEETARAENIENGMVWILGGIKNGGVVVGPQDENEAPVKTVTKNFSSAHEILGLGMLFRHENNNVKLHLHAAIGNNEETIIGCPRKGADCWLVNEVVIMEISGIKAKRMKDSKSGFELLEIFK